MKTINRFPYFIAMVVLRLIDTSLGKFFELSNFNYEFILTISMGCAALIVAVSWVLWTRRCNSIGEPNSVLPPVLLVLNIMYLILIVIGMEEIGQFANILMMPIGFYLLLKAPKPLTE